MSATEEVSQHIKHAQEFLAQLTEVADPAILWFESEPICEGETDYLISGLEVRQAYSLTGIELPDCNTMVQFIEDFDRAQGGDYSTYRECMHFLQTDIAHEFRTGSGFILVAYTRALALTLQKLVPLPA
ncbi:MAG TPA: hypothetical protein VGE30_00685 [Candidatus Saccharimonadales bacterium]